MISDNPAAVGETIGVEEEFHVVDPATGRLAPEADRVLAADGGDVVEPELQRSAVETASAVCRTLGELRADLTGRRRAVLRAAETAGLAVVTAGTVPDSGAAAVGVFPKDRYRYLADEYQQVAREQLVCAAQVQVAVPDPDLAVDLAGRIRPWLSVLLALSASSPFFENGDTGYASYRTIAWSRWPTAGPPGDFASAAEYEATVAALVRTGTIADPGMVYFDVRPSARYPTVEIRIPDACPLLDDVLLLAALGRALIRTAAADRAAGRPAPAVRQELLRAANWRAARYGLDGDLVDPVRAEAVPAAELVDRLLGHVRPALADRGEEAEVEALLAANRERGTSAARQRIAYGRTGDPRDVVAQLIAETAQV